MGVSYKFGKRSSDASLLLLPLFLALSLVSLALRLMSSLIYTMVRVGLAGLKSYGSVNTSTTTCRFAPPDLCR